MISKLDPLNRDPLINIESRGHSIFFIENTVACHLDLFLGEESR